MYGLKLEVPVALKSRAFYHAYIENITVVSLPSFKIQGILKWRSLKIAETTVMPKPGSRFLHIYLCVTLRVGTVGGHQM